MNQLRYFASYQVIKSMKQHWSWVWQVWVQLLFFQCLVDSWWRIFAGNRVCEPVVVIEVWWYCQSHVSEAVQFAVLERVAYLKYFRRCFWSCSEFFPWRHVSDSEIWTTFAVHPVLDHYIPMVVFLFRFWTHKHASFMWNY